MDVVVNPSLRAWSETFCIVNIEVLAMQKPLITFAVGGEMAQLSQTIHFNLMPVLSDSMFT